MPLTASSTGCTTLLLDCQKLSTRHRGEIAQLKILLEATERGFCCSKPVMEGCRYDLILDDARRLWRVQVKYAGIERGGLVKVSLQKMSGSIKRGVVNRLYSALEIDAVMVYVANLDKILWLPASAWEGKQVLHLRTAPTKNNQQKSILYVKDFLW